MAVEKHCDRVIALFLNILLVDESQISREVKMSVVQNISFLFV